MSTADVLIHRGPSQRIAESQWEHFEHEKALECRVVVCPEDEGGFAVHCVNLPGVISQGDTMEEAIENIADAFRESVLYYRGANESIPWKTVEIAPAAGSCERRILVSF